MKAVATVIPFARHVRTGLHRRRGYTTQPVERSHVPTRDRLRGTRGLRAVPTGQKFLESFEALHALRRGRIKLRLLVPTYRPTRASEHEKVRAVIAAMAVLGTQLKRIDNTHLEEPSHPAPSGLEHHVTSQTRNSGLLSPRSCGIAKGVQGTRGIGMRSVSPSEGSVTICGGPWLRTAKCWISLSNSGGTSAPPSVSFVNC
jgi:hypothetical protein